MDNSRILSADYLDIVFDGRNKKYGGYELRKKYPKRVLIAGGIIVGMAALLILYYVILSIIGGLGKDTGKPIMQQVTLAEPPPIDPNKPPPPPPPPAPPPPVKPTVQFTPPVIKKDEEVKEEEKPPPQEDLKDKAVSTDTKAGDPNGIDPGIVETPAAGPVETPAPPQIFKYVEQMPEFPGNREDYLSRNLRYPDAARENGDEGRSVIQFVVNEEGDISDVTVARSSGHPSLDAEARRVVAGMPRWKPGKQNGKAVKVQYTLPVTFKLD